MMVMMSRNVLVRMLGLSTFLFLFGWAEGVIAQPTNVEVLQALAAECLDEAQIPDSVIVDASSAQEYIRSGVVQSLLERNHLVFAPDVDSAPMATLRLRHDPPAVSYTRSRRRVGRNADLTLHLMLQAPDGRITIDSSCTRSYEDVIERGQIASLGSPAYPETTPTPPPASWRRRYAEPIIMAGATAVTILLFFSLRSKRTPDE